MPEDGWLLTPVIAHVASGKVVCCLSTVPSNLLSKRPHASEFQDSTDHLVGPQHWLVAEEIECRAVARSPRR